MDKRNNNYTTLKGDPPEARLLGRPEEIRALCEELKTCEMIGVDTEFIRETSFYPRMALIQVGSADKTWLIDPTVLSKEDLAPLQEILVDPGVLKIFHASYADQECFYWELGVMASPVLDTAVAAGLCGMGDSIGLQKLLREVLGVHVPKGRARAKWLTRPLPSELLHYAAEDVKHLVELALALKDKLVRHNRWDWALEESQVDSKTFDIDPQVMAEKLARGARLGKEQGALVELVRWREERARKANLPRGWVADNETLVSLAKVRPRTRDELKTFRGIHAKEVERSGENILEAIRKGNEVGQIWNDIDRGERLGVDSHSADFVQTYISLLADRLEIMPRYLISQHQAFLLLTQPDKSIEEWVSAEVLSANAAKLIGHDLKALVSGHRALVLKQRKLQVLDVE